MSARRVPSPSHPNQLELPLNVAPTPGFSVRRIEGHIVLTPKPLEMLGSTKDAALIVRRSDRWVRLMCERKQIKARRLPGSRKWDVDLVALQEWVESEAPEKTTEERK